MNIILAGTPKFSVKIFEQVIKHFNVVAIVSQPDRPAGRGYKIMPTPTKLLAQKHNIRLFQPEKISDIKEELSKLEPDLLLTCAFGQFIPSTILNIGKYKSLNIHGSLLPRHRGAAPIQYSILSGDEKCGITLIHMEKEMDAGDMIFKFETTTDNKTAADLLDELSERTSKVIVDWLNKYFKNDYIVTRQNVSEVTLAPKIKKADALITDADEIKTALLKIRAFNPYPMAICMVNQIPLKIFKASSIEKKDTISFRVKDGYIYLEEIQPPNKRKMSAKEFLVGH